VRVRDGRAGTRAGSLLAAGAYLVLCAPAVGATSNGNVTVGPWASSGTRLHGRDQLAAGLSLQMPGSHPAAEVIVTQAGVLVPLPGRP